MYRYDTTRGWREVLADGKEIPVLPEPVPTAPVGVTEFIDFVERSNKFKPVVVSVLRMMARQSATQVEATPAPQAPSDAPLKTGDVVYVSGRIFGRTGHATDVTSRHLCKIQIPGGYTVENCIELAKAGVRVWDGAMMMYVAPGTEVDTAWPEFQFLAREGSADRRHVVKVRRLRGVESRGFFVPVPKGWDVKRGQNIWTVLGTMRARAYGVLPPTSLMREAKPKLPKARKRDFRIRFKRFADGYIDVQLQRRNGGWAVPGTDGAWVTVRNYYHTPEAKK